MIRHVIMWKFNAGEAENMQKFCETGGFIPVRTSLLETELNYANFGDEMKIFSEIVGTIDPKLLAKSLLNFIFWLTLQI